MPCTTPSARFRPSPSSTAYRDESSRLRFYCASAFQFAIGEATSATLGAWVGAGQVSMEPVKAADVVAGKAINVQSPTAGAVVYATYYAL